MGGRHGQQSAAQAGIPIFPEKGAMTDLGFMDREMRYAKHWLASMGIYTYEEPHDPWWSEMHNFLLSVREGKPIIAPFALGKADAQGVIYGNRAMETGERVYWPGAEPQKAKDRKKAAGRRKTRCQCQVRGISEL